MSSKVIIVTGGNSGIGLGCCLALAAQANIHLILVGHDQSRVDQAVVQCQQIASASTTIEPAIVDLASLHAVRKFCESILTRHLDLFCMVCNAGVSVPSKTLTEDGFERTFAVNHLSHFLMIQMLQHHTKRIVTLSSETHDPAQHSPTPPPNVSDLDQLAVGYEPFNGTEAYTTSKLLTMLVAKEFVRRSPNGPEILAYSPGFVPDTGLYRDLAGFDAHKASHFIKSQGIAVGTLEYSGGVLAEVASSDSWAEHGWHNADFISMDKVMPASKQANDEALAKQVWEKSEQWIAGK